MNSSILIFGGDKDFNIVRFLKRLSTRGVKVVPVLFGKSGNPVISFDVHQNQLYIDKEPVNVDSAFIRYDVFEYLESKDDFDYNAAHARHSAILGWLLSNPQVKILNREYYKRAKTNKTYSLRLAIEAGFAVPETYVSNDLEFINSLLDNKAFISKELEGGSYTQELAKYDLAKLQTKKSDYPFFIQEKLIKPELRVFRIGDKCFSFKILSDEIDFRIDSKMKMSFIETDKELANKVIKVTDSLNLNFSALDFKTNNETGELMFLEANSQPMFAAFDQLCDYKLIDEFISFLL